MSGTRETTPRAPAPETASPVPVASGRWPGLGHAAALARHRLGYLQSLRAEGDAVRVYLGRRPVHLLNSPDLIRRLLAADSSGSLDKGRFFDKMRPVLGDGILTCRSAAHKVQRPLVQPAFHQERIRRYVRIMASEAAATSGGWTAGAVVRVDREMHDLALRIVTRSLFSSDVGVRAAEECFRLFPLVSAGVARRTLSPVTWWERVPTPGNRRFDAAVSRLHQVIDEVVSAYRTDGRDHGDLLSMLLAARDEDGGAGLSDAQLRDEALTIMGAGTETTSVSLSWLFYELDRHPEIRERVEAEVDAVHADGEDLGFEHVRQLPYTQQVVSETLRLHAPIWLLMRRAAEPLDLGGGVRLAPGDEVLFSPTALHRDPALHPDPLRFDPDRWSPERRNGVDRAAYLPFGAGSRRCIGDVFARTEMTVIAAAVVRRWRLTAPPGLTVREVASGSLEPDALPMTARPRD
ncbi:cytochrome P450 [Streptomyces sp. NBC_00005]|uniref:cytochrome P450 n=1 Tax=Streptomyces sp. NBC_00005 TaxID=2903609 RepID=UPI00324E5C4D